MCDSLRVCSYPIVSFGLEKNLFRTKARQDASNEIEGLLRGAVSDHDQWLVLRIDVGTM